MLSRRAAPDNSDLKRLCASARESNRPGLHAVRAVVLRSSDLLGYSEMRSHSNRSTAVFRTQRTLLRRRHVAFASSDIALIIVAHDCARAEDAGSANAIKLPDVTVQQALEQKAEAKAAEKPKSKAKAKSTVAVKRPSTSPVAPPPSVNAAELSNSPD